MFNTLKYYKLWFTVSGLIMLFGIISLSVYGLKLGIDFKGGTEMQVQFDAPYDISKVQAVLDKEGIGNYQVQTSDNNQLIIKTETLTTDQHNKISADL